MPPAARRAPRRRRCLPRGRGGQGHRDLLRHRQRDLRGIRLLAGRRLRLRRLGRLRPQEDGASRRAAPGNASSATSARWAWTSRVRISRSAGIGDMAGDVFGNGMLQSPHIRLVAAFNHQHIFLDPQPDAARSFRERERLFRLPRSSWDDYSQGCDLEGRRRVFAQRQELDACRAKPRRCWICRRRRRPTRSSRRS